MPTLHDLMADSFDNLALDLRDAESLPATRGLIARRRRRNAALAGGTSALALGGLVAGGIVQDLSADDAPASADPTAVSFVEVPLDAGATAYGSLIGLGPTIVCGDEVPDPITADQGFTQSVDVVRNPNLDNGMRPVVNASLSYDGSELPPAFVNSGYAVLARDGVVVGQFEPGWSENVPFEELEHGNSWDAGAVVREYAFQPAFSCDAERLAPPQPDDPAYAAGDYEIYVISQAHTSEAEVANLELADLGYYLASDSRGVWAPGSIDCQLASEWGDTVPLQCTETLPVGVTIDAATGTATLPYHQMNYGGDLQVTLVSDPIPVTLDHDITHRDWGYTGDSNATPSQQEPLACGSGSDQQFGYGAFEGASAQPLSFADLATGIDAPVLIDARTGDDRERGTLHFGDNLTAWVVIEGDSAGYWVAANATAILAPNYVPINRRNGYPDVSVRLEGLTDCAAPSGGPWAARNRDANTANSSLVIEGNFRIDWEDGSTTTADRLELALALAQ